jgi:hypothetical protein
MSKSSSAAASQISKDATGVRKRTASELAEELQIHAPVRSMHDRRAVRVPTPRATEVRAHPNSAHGRTSCRSELPARRNSVHQRIAVHNRGRAALQGSVKPLKSIWALAPVVAVAPEGRVFLSPFHLCRYKQQRTRALTLRARRPFVMLIR